MCSTVHRILLDNYACVILVMLLIAMLVFVMDRAMDVRRVHLMNRQFTAQDTYVKEGFAQVRGGEQFYRVHEDLENPEGAAETMDKLNIIANTMMGHLETKYSTEDKARYFIKPEYVETVLYGIAAMRRNYKAANLEENIPERSGGDTSYVIDKGSVFAMCLRDPRNNNKLDTKMNSLIFVLMHELTHLFTKGYGHDAIFWNNFRFVLQEAANAGLYTPINYRTTGSPYCGIVISYSPLFDRKLANYFVD